MLVYNNNLTTTLAAIYGNSQMTAQQQQAAADNARAASKSLFDTYAATMASGVPPIFWQPYQIPGQANTGTNPGPIIPGGTESPFVANPTPSVPVQPPATGDRSAIGEAVYRSKFMGDDLSYRSEAAIL